MTLVVLEPMGGRRFFAGNDSTSIFAENLKMELVVDAGNSAIKIYVFDNREVVERHVLGYDEFFSGCLPRAAADCPAGILCNVSGHDDAAILARFPMTACVVFSHSTAIPLENAYATPETLGLDRLAAAVGAEASLPHRNKLVFDFGTAITIDFVDEHSRFVGGNISLGLQSRFRALHEFTGKLPLLSAPQSVSLTGRDTEEAIRNGVVAGIEYEIEGYIGKYSSEFQNLAVFFTGGDGIYFEKRIKSYIFADQNLVAKGLMAILEFNEK